MLLIACAALTLAALLYVFWLTPVPIPAKSRAQRECEYLEEKRGVLYENLRDLHLEYRMGKLSDTDYQEMKLHYQEEMAALLHQLEAVSGAAPMTRAIPGRCLRCGKDNPVDNRFCGACGAEVLPAEMSQ